MPLSTSVQSVIKGLTLKQKIGQMVFPDLRFDDHAPKGREELPYIQGVIRDDEIGGICLFGGDIYETPAILNALQKQSRLPLLVACDVETGASFHIRGTTTLPSNMAVGATMSEEMARLKGLITARESRAVGINWGLVPVADVNNNPRNPVINTRSFGAEPGEAPGGGPSNVGSLVASYVRGLQDGGMIATLKHFPGHGDTDVDSHLGLPVVAHPRSRLDAVELAPFRQGIAAGAGAVMAAHIVLPSLDPTPDTPATFSAAVGRLLRDELGFGGLTVTDSMKMAAVAKMGSSGENAVRAFNAGYDLILDLPLADIPAAHAALAAAVARGAIDTARLDRAVERILRAKARLGLHRARLVSLDALPAVVGGRAHLAVAQQVSERAITLVKDAHDAVPLRTPRGGAVLYLSILDYPGGWYVAAPGRTLVPELRKRWANVTAIELSDRSTPAEIDLVRATASRYDAVVAGVYVRAASASGRMDLSPPLARLLQDLARVTGNGSRGPTPFVTIFFGNPYQATSVPELPTVLLTYDFYDLAERTAVRALAGEIPIRGRLPIPLPDLYPIGHGLMREAVAAAPQR